MTDETLQEDDLLIQGTLQGRPEAFRGIVEKYQRPIFDLCARMLQDEQEAADVVQDAFLRLYRRLPDYKAGHRLSNWLYTIALNLCRNRLRHRKVLKILSLDFRRTPDEGDPPLQWSERELSVPDQIEEKEAEALLNRLTRALPESLRAPFLLRYHRQLTDQEIAQILNISVGHVRVKLARARARLWEQFHPYLEDGVIPGALRGR